MELHRYSAKQLGDLVNSKELSVKDVLHYFENRIEERNHTTNAIVYQNWKDAYAEGEVLQSKIDSGEYVGPFAGVPIALKDFLPSKKGWPNTHGGVKSLTSIDCYDSEFYKACKKLGAIAIGKTNAPAFGFSGACLNKLYGQTHNPFQLNYNSGGSSGGSAAAVADGLVLIAEGGDAGGSIRIPSAWCNLYGFKPSIGTVPNVCRPDAWSATHPYCAGMGLTKTVEDAAILLSEMSRYDPRDPFSLPINSDQDFTECLNKNIDGTRIAFTSDFNLFPVEDDVLKIVTHGMNSLMKDGVDVDSTFNFNFKHSLEEMMFCWSWSISLDSTLDIKNWKKNGFDLILDHSDELPEEFKYFYEVAEKYDIDMFRTFNEIRTDILDNFENAFEDHDFIVSPTTICRPMKIEDEGKVLEVNGTALNPLTNMISFGETALVNFVGYPAASVPIGMLDNGIPVAIQIIGKQYHDKDVIMLSSFIENNLPWYHRYDIAWNRFYR